MRVAWRLSLSVVVIVEHDEVVGCLKNYRSYETVASASDQRSVNLKIDSVRSYQRNLYIVSFQSQTRI